ncbi:MAG TPA: PilN domain-containing protein [Methylomirabilota bacterium]|nr:PilN domain-containing protein [Methylomirabilota bacterium]
MAARIGLVVDNGRLTVVGIAGRDQVEHFVVEDAEDPAATLAAELQARGLTGRHLRVGLDRRLAVVKAIELPRAAGGDIGAMIGFELERHVPFPAESVRFDWMELPSGPDEPHHVLIVAAERRTVERPLGLLAAAHRRPAAVVIACHELPALLGREAPTSRAVWAHRHGEATDLLFLDGRRLLMSRRVTTGTTDDLAREIRRSLPMLRWSDCEAVWLSGRDAAAGIPDLAALMGVSVSAPPYAPDRAALVAALPVEEEGPALLALAVAVGPRSPLLNLLPSQARPWTPSREQLVTVGIIGVTALLGLTLALTHVIKTERHLGRLSQEIRRLDPEVKAVERLATELGGKRRMLAALQAAQDGRIPVLPVLRELTETLPQGAWLQGLTLDRQGVELVGQSDAASALIPLLEASERLERVEFTSPVTKSQNKEQFRLRAAWETRER